MTEKVEVLNAFFVSVFTGKICLLESQAAETRVEVWSMEDFLSVEGDQVRRHLKKPDIFKSMGPDGLHPQVLRDI